jgi:hypothetical protein
VVLVKEMERVEEMERVPVEGKERVPVEGKERVAQKRLGPVRR